MASNDSSPGRVHTEHDPTFFVWENFWKVNKELRRASGREPVYSYYIVVQDGEVCIP